MNTTDASRPRLPSRREYGAGEQEQLDWETASGWLERTRYYWLSTTRPDGRPHAVAVWAVWLEKRLWFTTSPETVSARNLDAYEAKYGWRLEPPDPGMPYFGLRPRCILAWRSADIRGTSRRWRFD